MSVASKRCPWAPARNRFGARRRSLLNILGRWYRLAPVRDSGAVSWLLALGVVVALALIVVGLATGGAVR